MSKHRKRVHNNTVPKENVNIGNVKLSDLIYIDLTKYPRWTDTVQIGDFTNCLQDSNEALRHFFFIVNRWIPDIEDYGMDIFSGKADHCHSLGEKNRELAIKIIHKIHGKRVLDDDSELWSLGGKTEEIRIIGTFVNSQIHVFYPLFIDHHHLVYPSKKYNSPDYKNFSFTKEDIKSAK